MNDQTFDGSRIVNPCFEALGIDDMEEVVIALFKAGELVFNFVETIHRKLFSDETDNDQ